MKGVSRTCLWASVGKAFFCWRELSEEVNPGMFIFHALSGVCSRWRINTCTHSQFTLTHRHTAHTSTVSTHIQYTQSLAHRTHTHTLYTDSHTQNTHTHTDRGEAASQWTQECWTCDELPVDMMTSPLSQ